MAALANVAPRPNVTQAKKLTLVRRRAQIEKWTEPSGFVAEIRDERTRCFPKEGTAAFPLALFAELGRAGNRGHRLGAAVHLTGDRQQTSDRLIARCQEWAANHYAEAAPVSAMVRLSVCRSEPLPGGLSRRLACRRWITFTRCGWRRRNKSWKPRIWR